MVNREVKITPQTKNTSTLKDLNFKQINKQYASKGIDFLKFQREDINMIKE